MSRRLGLIALCAVVAVVGTAAVVAQAGGDPVALECSDPYSAVGDVMPSEKSLRPTAAGAASDFVRGLTPDGKPISEDVELREISASDPAVTDGALAGDAIIAAVIDGKAVALLELMQGDGGWAVEGFMAC